MANLKDVHTLIHSLSKAEKIQFSLYANSLKGKAKDAYLLDFQCFLKQKSYDKDALKTALNQIKKRRNLSESNTNLYHFILDSLANNYAKKQQKLGFLKEIQAIEILFQKGLMEQCQQLFDKTKEKVKAVDNVGLEYYLLNKENEILFLQAKNKENYDARIALVKEQLHFTQQTEATLQLKLLKTQLFSLVRKIGTPRTKEQLQEYLNFKEREDLDIKSENLPNNSLADFFYVKYMLEMLAQSNKNSLLILKNGLQEILERIDIKQNYIPAYAISGFLAEASAVGKDEALAKECIETFSEIMPFFSSVEYKVSSKMLLHNVHLLFSLNFNKLKEAYAYIKENKTDILDPENLKLSPHGYVVYLSSARVCFLNEDYEQSLEFIDLLLSMKKNIRASLLVPIRMLYLLNHHKQDNAMYLPYAIRSLYRDILKSKQLYAPEKALLSFLRKSTQSTNWQKEMEKLHQKLTILKKDSLNASFFGNGDYLLWLEGEVS